MQKILFISPYKDFSGYASASRDYITSLDKIGVPTAIRPLRYDCGDYTDERLSRLENIPCTDAEIIVQQTTPNEMKPKSGKFNVGAFCWETDVIPEQWVESLNSMDLILVPCMQNMYTARKCGVVTPVEKVNYACDTYKYSEGHKPFLLSETHSAFKFLSIFQYSKKKSFDVLLKAYLSEFNNDENVCLIIKTYMGINDTQEHLNKIRGLIQAMKELLRIKKYPQIKLIHGIMPHNDICRLYKSSDCYVLPSRGEGWGVPHFDALGFGLPAIATKGTGPEEFISDDCGWLVNSHSSPVIDMPHPFDYLYTGKENWREPHVGHLKQCMREAYELWSARHIYSGWDDMCNSAKNKVFSFNHEKIGDELYNVIMKYYEMWRSNETSNS